MKYMEEYVCTACNMDGIAIIILHNYNIEKIFMPNAVAMKLKNDYNVDIIEGSRSKVD